MDAMRGGLKRRRHFLDSNSSGEESDFSTETNETKSFSDSSKVGTSETSDFTGGIHHSKVGTSETSDFTGGIHHRKDVFTELNELWKTKDFTDIIFHCEDGTVKAHKLILSARSLVFRAMFESGMTESSSNTIKIEDIKLETMKILLEYMYTGCVNPLTIEEMSDLLRAADKYQMNKLKKSCFDLLISKLKVNNTGDIVMLAHLHSAPVDIKQKIQEYILKMRGELWRVPEFQLMVHTNPTVFTTFIFENYFTQ